jgi:hypothetical protein
VELSCQIIERNPDRIGGTTKHHVNYLASGAGTDDASAQRAKADYNIALSYLKAQDYDNAAKTARTMTHYIVDLAILGHVMGAPTPWGTEAHHSDYEDHVLTQTSSNNSSFTSYLSFDDFLSTSSAYDAALIVAYDTTFGGRNHLTCTWIDTN